MFNFNFITGISILTTFPFLIFTKQAFTGISLVFSCVICNKMLNDHGIYMYIYIYTSNNLLLISNMVASYGFPFDFQIILLPKYRSASDTGSPSSSSKYLEETVYSFGPFFVSSCTVHQTIGKF